MPLVNPGIINRLILVLPVLAVLAVILLGAVHGSTIQHGHPTSTTCKKLENIRSGKVSYSNTTTYGSSIESYFYETLRERPDCIFSPVSTSDVAKAVPIIASSKGTKFAFRSGGHSPHPEVSNTEDGVTIDLRGLNTFVLSKKDNVLQIGAGVPWSKAYEFLYAINRTAVGARSSSIGVGGFISGGGLSFYSPDQGFACDNVVNFEIVLASGAIVNADATSNADLFHALRGGQSNFGIITRFDVATFAGSTMWGGAIYYPLDQTEDAQLAAFLVLKTGKYNPFVAIEMSFIYTKNNSFVSNNMVYLQPTVNATSLRRFTSVEPQLQDTMRIDTAANFAEEIELGQAENQYAIFACTSFYITPTIMKKINKMWRHASVKLGSIDGYMSVLTYQQFLPQRVANAFGFDPEAILHEKLVVLVVSEYWTHPDKDSYARVKAVTEGLFAQIESLAKHENAYHPFKFVNYAGQWQAPYKGVTPTAYARLRAVSTSYDPYNVFQKQAVGFKL